MNFSGIGTRFGNGFTYPPSEPPAGPSPAFSPSSADGVDLAFDVQELIITGDITISPNVGPNPRLIVDGFNWGRNTDYPEGWMFFGWEAEARFGPNAGPVVFNPVGWDSGFWAAPNPTGGNPSPAGGSSTAGKSTALPFAVNRGKFSPAELSELENLHAMASSLVNRLKITPRTSPDHHLVEAQVADAGSRMVARAVELMGLPASLAHRIYFDHTWGGIGEARFDTKRARLGVNNFEDLNWTIGVIAHEAAHLFQMDRGMTREVFGADPTKYEIEATRIQGNYMRRLGYFEHIIDEVSRYKSHPQ